MSVTVRVLDRLWQNCIKARDKRSVFSFEIYGRTDTEGLVGHHILGKATHRLRWELDNGITITTGQHNFVAHGSRTRQSQFEQWALDRLPKSKRDKLGMMKWQTGGVDKEGVKIYLEQKLKEYSGRTT